MSDSVAGRALVTGGSRGIGRAVVEALLDAGWRVAFCGRNPDSVAAALGDFATRHGERVHGRVVDVRDQGAVERFVDEALAVLGDLDLAVNNAGIGRFGAVDELSGETWREVLETNLSGPFYVLRAVARPMRKAGRGTIVNVASLAGRHPFAGGAAYNASKAGLLALSEAAMLDLRSSGVRVAAVLPGSVDTDFGHPAGERRSGVSDWRLQPEDVAAAVLHLASYPQRALPSLLEIRPTRTGKG